MNIVRLSEVRSQAWRNGGGRTHELLAWPDASDWTLRVSVAQIERDGPFSAYPGIGRHFVVLSGEGVALSWPAHVAQLTPRSEPLSFDGAEAPTCRLMADATEDLNLMVRHDAGIGHLRRALPGQAWKPRARWRGLYSHESAVLEVAGSEWPLAARSLVWTDDTASSTDSGVWTLHAAHAGHAFWLWLETDPA